MRFRSGGPLLALGLLAGCGGDGDPPAPTTPSPPPSPEPAQEPPTVPRGLHISATGPDFIEWRWQFVESVSGYDVQYSTNEAFTDQDEVIPRTAEEISYRKEGLGPETRGYVRVRAARGVGVERITSEWSQPAVGTTTGMDSPVPATPSPERDCRERIGYAENLNLRLVDSGFDFVTYAWDEDPCVEVYDFQLRKVYDYGLERGMAIGQSGAGETRRVNQPRATFAGLTDGVYGPRGPWLNSSENPFGYVLLGVSDRFYFDRSLRYERWEDSPVVCTGEMETEARRTGSVLLQEWDRDREPFTVNIHVSLDNAPGFDADWVLAEAEEAVDRFREVLRTPLLKIGDITSQRERLPGEVLIAYGPYPDPSSPWADQVWAFASAGTGTVTMVRKPWLQGGDDLYDKNLKVIDSILIHEIFHLFGFRHYDFPIGSIGATPPGPVGVDMTPEMTTPGVDTLQDFAALRCVLRL